MSVNMLDNSECWFLMVLDCNSFPTCHYGYNATRLPTKPFQDEYLWHGSVT